MIKGTVRVRLAGLIKFKDVVAGDLRRKENGPIRDALHQWGARYRAFITRRYVKMSKGGWKPLKGKRKRGSKIAALILRDTGTMMAAVQPEFTRKPGQLQEDIKWGIRVGYGGPGRHPKGKATIADIASFHQLGKGSLPVRKIIVPPDQGTIKGMKSDMERAMIKLDRMTDHA